MDQINSTPFRPDPQGAVAIYRIHVGNYPVPQARPIRPNTRDHESDKQCRPRLVFSLSVIAVYNHAYMIKLIGFVAAICTTVAFAPQLIKAWKTRSTKDISLAMFLVFFTGVALWLLYGVLIGDAPVAIANAVTLILSGAILALKLKYK